MTGNKDIRDRKPETGRSGLYGPQVKSLAIKMLFGIPAVLLAGAYLYMAVFYHKIWLFDTIVHENGKYTLLQVIFYFRHFSWEMPGKAVYSFFLVGAFWYYGNAPARGEKTDIPYRNVLLSGVALFAIIVITILVTTYKVGVTETLHGLLQYRTSEIKPVDFGSHWRNHFLSNIVLFSASAFFICLYRTLFCGGWVRRKYANLFFISVGIFVLLSIFFGINADPFTAPSYLGHQLREIFGSDLPITMLLSMAVLIFLERKYDRQDMQPALTEQLVRRSRPYLLLWLMPVVLISGYIVLKVLSLDISGEMSKLPGTENWTVINIFAWHFFEHSLDYVFVISLVSFLYLLMLRSEFGRKKADEGS